MTSKILGDDTRQIMDFFEDFLRRKTKEGGEEQGPFLAVLWLHTNHMPHPAMPEWYNKYKDANGQPAGDYLGTISQMDSQIGRLRDMLRTYKIANNTALWFTADNGPHTNGGGGCSGPYARSSNQATNGLRQCKASLFEGGIREPGILEWPDMIHEHRETEYPAYVSDYLPTFLDAVNLEHPNPEWYADGTSLMPLLRASSQELMPKNRSKPLGFQLGDQEAWIDNEWKLVRNPNKGQCKTMLPPYDKNSKGYFLFNLVDDPTESHDMSKENPEKYQAMVAALTKWIATIDVSQVKESQCAQGSGPSPSPGPPPDPPSGGFALKVTKNATSECLTLYGIGKHAAAEIGHCDGASAWNTEKVGHGENALVNLASGLDGNYLKVMFEKVASPCTAGNTVLVGKETKTNIMTLMPSSVGQGGDGMGTSSYTIASSACTGMCAGLGEDGSSVVLQPCKKALVFERSSI